MSSLKIKKNTHRFLSGCFGSDTCSKVLWHNESLWCLLPVDELGSDLLHLATSASASIDPWSILIEIHHVIPRADLSNRSVSCHTHSSSPKFKPQYTLYIGECQGKCGVCVIDFLNQCGATEWDFFGCALIQVSTGHYRHPHIDLIQDQFKTCKPLKVSEFHYFSIVHSLHSV
jgi:hypothetical protein